MGDNYWELTIAELQDPKNPLVDKPKLSEKYLTKPPFRFLHDVISAVQAKTGFGPGLFQGDELDGKALQDKDAKVLYLTKILNLVGFVLGELVPAKPLKIVAGLEPENTNLFLQMLGKAAQKGDGAAFVPKVIAGEQPGAAAAAAEKPKAKPKPKPKPAAEEAPAAAPAAEEPAPPPAEKPKKAKPKAPPPPAEDAPAAPPPAAEEPPKEEKKKKAPAKPKPKEEDAPLPAPAPEAADLLNASAGSATAAAQRSLGRPQSARKAPPKLPAATPAPAPSIAAGAAAAPAAGAARPGTASRRGPEPAAAKPIMLFEEGTKGDDDDDVEVVHEQRPVAVGAVPEGEQGVLVKNILEAEKALKKTRDEGEDEAAGSGIILKRLGKATAAAGVKASDHQGIREMVQKLTQSSHPLAKSMDYLQEDLENMAKEYRFWVTERRVFQEKLGDEQRMAQDQAAADARLADLEGQVRQVRDRTLGLKAQILRNDETISKLLSMAVSGGR